MHAFDCTWLLQELTVAQIAFSLAPNEHNRFPWNLQMSIIINLQQGRCTHNNRGSFVSQQFVCFDVFCFFTNFYVCVRAFTLITHSQAHDWKPERVRRKKERKTVILCSWCWQSQRTHVTDVTDQSCAIAVLPDFGSVSSDYHLSTREVSK